MLISAKRAGAKLSAPQVAQRYGIDPVKVHAWIKSGELRAINAATRRSGRPRYLIDETDLMAFEASRAVVPSTPAPRRRRRTGAGVTEFFR